MLSFYLTLQLGVTACLSSPAPQTAPTSRDPAKSVAVRQERVPRITFNACVLTLTDGRLVPAEQGVLLVPERRTEAGRADRNARQIRVGITRLKGRNSQPSAPIVYLDGFPQGAAASGIARIPALFAFFDQLRDVGDVLLMDYRGSGFSEPSITCAMAPLVDGDALATRTGATRYWGESAAQCAAASLRGRSIDPGGYTWLEIAHDVGALRDALDVSRIRLVGFSSGTQAALATVRIYGNAIERAVLIGTEGPGDAQKLPADVDAAVAMVGHLLAQDPRWANEPAFPVLIDSVLRAVDRAPVAFTAQMPDAQGGRVQVSGHAGRFLMQYLLAKSLSGPAEFANLPRLMAEVAQGDSTNLLRVMQRRLEAADFNALGYLLDGAADASSARIRLIRAQASTALLSDAANFPVPEVAHRLGAARLPDRYRIDVASAIPTLFVTGELDGNTPPAQAERVRAGFPHSTHIIVKNAGHGDPMRSTDVARAVARFLDDGSVPVGEISVPAPRFAPPPAKRQR